VLKGVDFTVDAGCIFALLGSNGAGKTTTIRILATLLSADKGRASVCELDVARDAAHVREHISMTGQFTAVDDMLTGRENLMLVAKLRHVGAGGSGRGKARGGASDDRCGGASDGASEDGRDNGQTPKQVASALLERFGLTDAADRKASTYSGGMKRRLDIAMSLIGDPDVIFLDEPTTGLDPEARLEVWDTVNKLREAGTTILLTTQYLNEAERLADRIAILHDGRIIANGTLDELKALLPPAKKEYVEKQPTLEEIFLHITGGIK
jgi:ABC-2 type transport system ATP-binding protein